MCIIFFFFALFCLFFLNRDYNLWLLIQSRKIFLKLVFNFLKSSYIFMICFCGRFVSVHFYIFWKWHFHLFFYCARHDAAAVAYRFYSIWPMRWSMRWFCGNIKLKIIIAISGDSRFIAWINGSIHFYLYSSV